MKNLTKIISVIITSVFLLASFSTGAFAGKKILFSIKGPGSGNPFWASVEKGAKEEAAKLGVDLVLVAPPQEGDVQAQINQVEDQLAKGVDAIALAPGDPNAFAPIVDDAIKSGVPVVFVDTKGINEGVTFIGTNNKNGAALAANSAPFILFVPIKVTPSLIPLVSTNTTGTPLLIASSTIGAKAFGSPGASANASTPFASWSSTWLICA